MLLRTKTDAGTATAIAAVVTGVLAGTAGCAPEEPELTSVYYADVYRVVEQPGHVVLRTAVPGHRQKLVLVFDMLMDVASLQEHLTLLDEAGDPVEVQVEQGIEFEYRVAFELPRPSAGNVLEIGERVRSLQHVPIAGGYELAFAVSE